MLVPAKLSKAQDRQRLRDIADLQELARRVGVKCATCGDLMRRINTFTYIQRHGQRHFTLYPHCTKCGIGYRPEADRMPNP